METRKARRIKRIKPLRMIRTKLNRQPKVKVRTSQRPRLTKTRMTERERTIPRTKKIEKKKNQFARKSRSIRRVSL